MKHLLIAAVAAATFAGAVQAQDRPARDFDTNHDGKVTFAEFQAMQAGRTARMFQRLDQNKDGKITKAEAAAMAQAPAGASPGGGGPRSGGGGMFMRMDANGDGVVTQAEMTAMSRRPFDAADTNHDGWLSKGEVLLMQQRMGGGPPRD